MVVITPRTAGKERAAANKEGTLARNEVKGARARRGAASTALTRADQTRGGVRLARVLGWVACVSGAQRERGTVRSR